ncbi:phosphate/phosphite/phosphonate ABC transporter substrate-binding protein [Rossellomorea vietnamensis]|uniref:Phosphate/phosphite/phosphonate ABC transporter substrate-binding protein n=2 Tax=Rossellomorea TaxID=2837508 RepID=A0A5D4KLT3_9BACI|nr:MULTISPECIES: phosphate/phosphite/phosphonate ABC transporter substrate-binding protein [Rossellomorea]TYR77736.1 phosphate/phosphite/phosphonate ABC transporter substrate-binding protein [Rossellomorea vietnamensis]TYS83433.1 phosphate/phosphite/phosphonate ABC transporter substrate-binding protein [Rossellomorea aquimaris]
MKKLFSFLLVLLLAAGLVACGTNNGGNNASNEGSTGNSGEGDTAGQETPDSIVMGFVPSQDSETIADTVQPLADRLGEELGVEVEGKTMTDYTALIEAMGSNEVQVGFIPAFGYVLANEQYDVEVILKSVRHGSGTYKAQYVVQADSGIESLEDLEGKIWAYPDAASTSGFLFPAAQLMEEFDIESAQALQTEFFSDGIQAGGHDSAAIAVYEGDADVATTFDDVRTTLTEEYPDIEEKLKVIGHTTDIPNDTISVTKELDDEFQQKIKEAFLSFNDDPEMIEIMNEVYSWDEITEASDEEYQVVKDTYEKFKDSISF